MGPIRMPMSLGRGASGGGWLVANVCVFVSPITIGMQIDTPQRRPPSRSQSARASWKNCCARGSSTWAPAGAEQNESFHELRLEDQHAQVHRDRLHDHGGDVAVLEPRLEAVERVGIERWLESSDGEHPHRVIPVADTQRAQSVAVIGVLDGD